MLENWAFLFLAVGYTILKMHVNLILLHVNPKSLFNWALKVSSQMELHVKVIFYNKKIPTIH